jgi:hypothetical protein
MNYGVPAGVDGVPFKQTIPAKVAAAMEFLRHAESLRNPPASFDGTRPEARDLDPKEKAVYSAALEVLRLYFAGEQDYAPSEGASEPPPEDDPRNPVKVPT